MAFVDIVMEWNKMKYRFWLFIAVGAFAVYQVSCSKTQTPAEPEVSVSVHEDGWVDPNAQGFHGEFLADRKYENSDCQQCHGNDFTGGIVQVSCRSCHNEYPHPDGWVGTGEASHKKFIMEQCYQLTSCKGCHGEDYDELMLDQSCRTCHTQEAGPEACNTCHGVFAADSLTFKDFAPPRGLNGETEETDPAVGAHQHHLNYFESAEATCNECHKVPESLYFPGHVDDCDHQAELTFNGPLGTLVTEGGNRIPEPAYDVSSNSCASPYCHGNWGLLKSESSNSFAYIEDVMRGNSATPVWIDESTAECGTCHDLPPKGHTPAELTICGSCHLGVVDAEGSIIDKTKHINGKINVFGQETPMR